MAAKTLFQQHRGRGEWNVMDTKIRLCAAVALAFAPPGRLGSAALARPAPWLRSGSEFALLIFLTQPRETTMPED